MLWNGNKCRKKKGDENLKTTYTILKDQKHQNMEYFGKHDNK